jgi:hypothetical protein
MFVYPKRYQVLVVGADHACIEAGMAAARLGCETQTSIRGSLPTQKDGRGRPPHNVNIRREWRERGYLFWTKSAT